MHQGIVDITALCHSRPISCVELAKTTPAKDSLVGCPKCLYPVEVQYMLRKGQVAIVTYYSSAVLL